ncbi:MAG: FAD-dependent oxidoreductase [Candidatus Woesearchaeota archaeon]
MTKNICILGGGLAGLSLAYFLDLECTIFEKEHVVGGLARSFSKEGIFYDIGPHILFSKDQEFMDWVNGLFSGKLSRLLRSNQIWFKSRFVKYPFENHLFQLPKPDSDFCLRTFLDNPYKSYDASNMLSFFLKNFGEGITNLYLKPYNEKIWKFDPYLMSTQMVSRIPKPPRQDIIDGYNSKPKEGYVHQLYFQYPESGGIQELPLILKSSAKKAKVFTDGLVVSVKKLKDKWCVRTTEKSYEFDNLVSTIPLQELSLLLELPKEVKESIANLKFNSIVIVLVNVDSDNIGNNFSVNLPEKKFIFHRVSKLDCLGKNYSLPGSSNLLAEITFREGDSLSGLTDKQITDLTVDSLKNSELISKDSKVNFTDLHREKYAYVIYDLDHAKNICLAKEHLNSLGMFLLGRFSEFEYLNMDQVVSRAKSMAQRIRMISL